MEEQTNFSVINNSIFTIIERLNLFALQMKMSMKNCKRSTALFASKWPTGSICDMSFKG